MKVTIPEISWHNRDPVLALDIQPNPSDGVYRLATAGTDTHVVVWQLKILDNGGISVEALSDLTRHNRAVNAVRFSPDGEILATADDEAAIILWKKQDSGETDIFDELEKENKENWIIHKMLRGHLEDVYDISWSKCSQYLISGSVDNTAIVWDVSKGKHLSLLKEHKGFVQGVAWDPINQYVATLCSDRCCRIYNFGTKKITYKIDKASLPMTDTEDNVTEKLTRLFYDDTLKSFCRRLAFSPDGEILVTPSGIVEEEEGKTTNVTYVFSRYDFAKPALFLPTKDKYTLAVRFSPMLYELKPLMKEENKEEMQSLENNNKDDVSEDWKKYANILDLPYRMIFAVATQNALFLYDTQQPVPFAKISNMHYTRLSDIAWSSDGRILVVSSTDGYCSLVSFGEGELGTEYKKTEDTPQKPTPTETDQKQVEDVEMSSIESPEDEKAVNAEAYIPGIKEKLAQKETPSENKNHDEDVDMVSVEKSEDIKEASGKLSGATKDNKSATSTAKPIAVRRAGDSNKTGKRISLTTLPTPSQKSETPTSNKSEAAEAKNQTQGEDLKVESKVEKLSTPVKAALNSSPLRMSPRTGKRVSLITISSPKDKRKGSSKGSAMAEAENQSPLKTAKETASDSSNQRTPRRMQLTTISSPKSKANLDEKSPPKASPRRTARRLPLSNVSSPEGKKATEDMELAEEIAKKFEGDLQSPKKTPKKATPGNTPTSSSKMPRRVPLVTLSSPKGKRSLGGDTR